ncbi:MAG TPA: helix-turn-helix domain-containing protein [Oculatellaceae cyanobacterium]
MNKKNDTFYCPTEYALHLLAGKWKPAIMWLLDAGPRKFSELEELLFDIPKQSLVDRLRELEQDGLVERFEYSKRPSRFQYKLTEAGTELWHLGSQLCQWAERRTPGTQYPSALVKSKFGLR